MQSAGFLSNPAISLGIGAAFVVFFLTTAFLLWRLSRRIHELEERQRMFLKGKNGADLEAVVLRHDQEISTLDTELQELFDHSEKIRALATIGIHKVGIVRFNPFQDTGSNQSWSIALLDGTDTGLVISSLLSRESARVYAKPVVKGQPQDFPLTDEERRAIKLAQNQRETAQKSPNHTMQAPKTSQSPRP